RAFIIQPDVLLMDEPFSALDELTAASMRREMLELWKDLGCTVVFVTHNSLEAAFMADRILIMSKGPGRVSGVLRVTDELPRPRDADDPRLWRLSRKAVQMLDNKSDGSGSELVSNGHLRALAAVDEPHVRR